MAAQEDWGICTLPLYTLSRTDCSSLSEYRLVQRYVERSESLSEYGRLSMVTRRREVTALIWPSTDVRPFVSQTSATNLCR